MPVTPTYQSVNDSEFKETPDQLASFIIWTSCSMLFVEYTFVPISYLLGGSGYVFWCYFIQAAFFVASVGVQWHLYKKFESALENAKGFETSKATFWTLRQPLKEIGGVKVSRINCCGVSEVVYLCASLSPNFINILSSASFVGGSAQEWTRMPDAQNSMVHMWAHVPVVGWSIGHTPLPGLLTYMLVWTCFVYAASAAAMTFVRLGFDRYDGLPEIELINICDSANMLFIGKDIARREMDGQGANAERHGARFLVVFITRVILLWGKISLLSVIVDELSFWQVFNAWQAIILSFYSTLPLVIDYWKMLNRLWDEGYRFKLWKNSWVLPFVFLVVMVLPIHVAGIIGCPSHDFSVLVAQCT